MTNQYKICKGHKLPSFDSSKEIIGPYIKSSNNRNIVIVISKDNKGITHNNEQLLSRYLAEQHLCKHLKSNESVDHIDGNKLNDDISNLRVIDIQKHIKQDVKKYQLQKVICGLCNNEFEIHPSKILKNIRQRMAGPFCSKKCSAIYSRSLVLGKIKPLPTLEPNIVVCCFDKTNIQSNIPFNENFHFAYLEALNTPLLKKIKVINKKEFKKYEYFDSNYYGRSYHKDKNGRAFLILVSVKNPKIKKHITYAKFLMENHLKRFLDPDTETVDHINNDCSDDRIENLQLLTRSENAKKSFRSEMAASPLPSIRTDRSCEGDGNEVS